MTLMTAGQREAAFPIGASVTLAELTRDPYPVFERLREREPISWIPALNMWFATRYADVRQILLDTDNFTTAWDQSTIFDIFGANMLTTEGKTHHRYRRALQQPFMVPNIRQQLEPAIADATQRLIAGFGDVERIELRRAFASRLPIQTILLTFGMTLDAETAIRHWYDSFEQALANFTGDPAIRAAAKSSIAAFDSFLDDAIAERRRQGETETLLGRLVNETDRNALQPEEIKRNIFVIFFGGISTVEALILNAIWALARHPSILQRVQADAGLIDKVLDETMRWLGPVQSATRHVTRDIQFNGVYLREGDVLNCMLGGANHDPAVFEDPAKFDIDRSNAGTHLGFATGSHLCIGFRLAKAEAAIAIRGILNRFPDLEIVDSETTSPEGSEFRRPKALTIQSAS